MKVEAVRVVAGLVADVESAVLCRAKGGLDLVVVQDETIDSLVNLEPTRIAKEASRSFEYVM